MPVPNSNENVIRTLSIALIVAVGLVVGLVGGIVAFAGGDAVPDSIVQGGVAFAGAVTLGLLIESSLRPRS
ncbi:hypothetical protein AB0G06_04940 [Nonomuraea dietziae]|uniref:hypothetical protein n=1 Tax=Nonomuraea dietziae TaxID=65515 RepID=UPI00341016D7